VKYFKLAVGLVTGGILLLTVFAAFVWLPLALVPPAIALIVAGLVVDVPKKKTPPAP
jgi:hypothetical protein